MKYCLVSVLTILYFSVVKCSLEFGVNNLINTSKCTIPDIPTFSPDVILPTRFEPIPCTEFNPLLSYTTIEHGVPWLRIRNEVVTRYFGSPWNLSCCYSYVFRNGSEEFPDVGVAVTECYKFQTEVELNYDIVWVSCSKTDDYQLHIHGFPISPIYENIHQVVRLTSIVQEKTKKFKETSNKKPISVLMLVLDSISRLNFIRTMPKTRHFIMENRFYELIGYNKVNDNTFPNAMAFLTGMNLKDSINKCKPNKVDGLNNCPFIWNQYNNMSYATAFAEDWSPIATFNYLKKGFKRPPTDYYFKPYMDAITYLKPQEQDFMPFCAGPESQGDRIMNLAYDFATTLKGLPSFGLFWMNTFSHNYILSPATMDKNVKNLFKKLKSSGILDESLVILLSDHGIRFGDINKSTRGFYELRLPMHFISLPNWFKQTYPEESRNFKKNSEKLTSNYDLYMTLQHLLQLSGTNYTSSPSLACPKCKSLFEDIEVERSCSDAGIPEEWCTCNINFPGNIHSDS